MNRSGPVDDGTKETDEQAITRPENPDNTTVEELVTLDRRGKLSYVLERSKIRIKRFLQKDNTQNVRSWSYLTNFYKQQAEQAQQQILRLHQQLAEMDAHYVEALQQICHVPDYKAPILSSTEFIPDGQPAVSLQAPPPGTSAVSYPTQSFPQQPSYSGYATEVSDAVTIGGKARISSITTPAPPPGPKVVVTGPTHQKRTLLPQEALRLIPTRPVSARAKLGARAVLEARKGLSRVIQATSKKDIECFKEQLQHSDPSAIEKDWENEDRLPIFAVSYMQHTALGRFKFNEEQWECFVCIVEQLAASGVDRFRIWLDQCLWLRDASQGGWAHTGILPYILWPVICLGKKKVGGETSVETEERMWPFLEEVSGLWGMGVMFGREMRSKNSEAGWRKWMSYVHRARLEPEECMKLLLLNIFHGATDELKTGWQDDVRELKEMARANVLMDCAELFIGSDWKTRLNETKAKMKGVSRSLQYLTLQVKSRNGEGTNTYLDGSRTVINRSWDGLRAWLSGDSDGVVVSTYLKMAHIWPKVGKVQVICEQGEFELLQFGKEGWVLWMLVCMEGFTSNFSRGKVAWSKIVTGLESCQLYYRRTVRRPTF